MPAKTMTPPNAPDGLFERHIDFPENRLLVDLCGEFDRNLAQIETALGVQIARRGNELTVIGSEDLAARGAEVLAELYARLETGRKVEAGDIDAAIRMGNSNQKSAARDEGQLEMFKGGRIEIKTRKKTVEPRTEAQKNYARSLFEREMAFGIGPAGTGKTYIAVAVGVSMFIEGHVDRINGYSAHADQEELLQWAWHFDQERLQKIFLVHGEPEGACALAEELRGQGHSDVVMPTLHQSFEF